MRLSLVLLLGLTYINVASQITSNPKDENYPYPIQKTDEEWKKMLSDEQFYILRQQGTEYAFSGAYWDNKKKGNLLLGGYWSALIQLRAQV